MSLLITVPRELDRKSTTGLWVKAKFIFAVAILMVFNVDAQDSSVLLRVGNDPTVWPRSFDCTEHVTFDRALGSIGEYVCADFFNLDAIFESRQILTPSDRRHSKNGDFLKQTGLSKQSIDYNLDLLEAVPVIDCRFSNSAVGLFIPVKPTFSNPDGMELVAVYLGLRLNSFTTGGNWDYSC